mgnify:CR=1 FL=1
MSKFGELIGISSPEAETPKAAAPTPAPKPAAPKGPEV